MNIGNHGHIPRDPGIYAIENQVNGKLYIGSSIHMRDRINRHFWALQRGEHWNPHLQAAFDKYGADAFISRVLLPCNPRALICNEQFLIDLFKPHYNMSPVAGTSLGRKASEETRRKQRAAMTGKRKPPISEETRQRIGDASRGRVPSEETRRKTSAALKGRARGAPSEETRRKISATLTGRTLSAEHKQHMSEGNKGRVHSEETRLKISNTLTGNTRSEETKRKLSVAGTGRVMSEEARRKVGEANHAKRGKKRSEESKRRMSEAHKGKKYGPRPEEWGHNISEGLKRGNQERKLTGVFTRGRPGKFTEQQVIEIRQALIAGEKGLSIARRYGVNHHVIYGIKNGHTYRWVP